ncbi:MAG TPA: DUF2027 domain-containing protein [Bacteroidales bacterium]|nr:DUF2027 domain-containing protein [Bacteroidales bacterium]
MKNQEFSIGDTVRFLDEVGSGTISSLMPNGMVMVLNEDGFEYPMHRNQLVLVGHSKQHKVLDKPVVEQAKVPVKQTPIAEPETKPSERKNDRMRFSIGWLAIDSNAPDNGNLSLQLINDSEYDILFQVIKHDDTGIRTIGKGLLDAAYTEELHVFDREKLNHLKKIVVQAIFAGHFGMRQRSPIEKHVKTETLQFFIKENFIDNDYFEQPCFIQDIINDLDFSAEAFDKIIELQQQLHEKEDKPEDKSAIFKKRKTPETIEVDLHINKLLDNVRGMSNAEILEYQMQHFHKALSDAMFQKAGRIVFIHGIGNGTLRDKLRESLKSQYKLTFQDASFQEYGFGATMVFLSGKQL